jgi:hypothetical protein
VEAPVRLPARFVTGNLVWARRGSVWAVFRAPGSCYPWLGTQAKLELHQQTRAALAALPGEAMLVSICHRLPAAELAARIARGVPAAGSWGQAAGPAPATAAGLRPTGRVTFLVAELPAAAAAGGLAPALGAARAALAESFGLAGSAVRPSEISRRGAQAAALLDRLVRHVGLEPATPAEICWIYAAAVGRGRPDAPPFPATSPAATGQLRDLPRSIAAPDAIFKEGGLPEDPARPRHRRYLRVDLEAFPSYQAFLALAAMPHEFTFPGGGEWLAAADEAGFPVDWCVRLRPIDSRAAQASARRQARQLRSQVGEYDGDPAGAPPALAEAIEALGDLRAQLAANPTDTEIQATTIFAVGAGALADLEEQVAALRARYGASGYLLQRPIGGQLGLFAAMLPGAPAGSPARDYAHHLLGRDLAAGMPFAGADAGDPHGALIGYSLDAGTFRPVFFDPAFGPSINRSGSLGAFGALGSGKSYFIKNVIYATLARGGRVVVLDRTVSGEYTRLAPLAPVPPGAAQVIRLSGSGGPCLDPLRLFADDQRLVVALGFLTLATGTSPGELPGIALAEAVEAVAGRPGGRLSDVVGELERAAGSDWHAEEAWRALRHAGRNPLSRVAFGEGRPASLDADYLVFHAPDLALPDREVALQEHLARRLLPEQVLSQALLYLVAAAARHVAFSDASRFAAAVFDEAWCLTSSLQGRALLLDGIRDGRKHNAAVWLLSQHPGDLGDDQLAHLLGPRFVFRQPAAAAPAALHFAGVEPSERAIAFLTSAPDGACLFRDVQDRVGRMQVLPALSRELHEAFETNPARTARPPA